MHMADALLSPGVGLGFLAASCAALALSARRLAPRLQQDSRLPALMGVLGAFVFAAQMINFTIPGTGSSGHLGGGMLLAILLGPWAGLIVIASVLLVQALFFADGGLLAWGANVFNLGVLSCFVLYPLVFRPLCGKGGQRLRVSMAALISCTLAMMLGAFGVSLETAISGITYLPLAEFLALMLPIHLAIGLVEGGVTAAVLAFVARRHPALGAAPLQNSTGGTVAAFILAALLTGGVLSWFASSHPDGLEWSITRLGAEHLLQQVPQDKLAQQLASVQQATSVLPGYDTATPLPESGMASAGTSLAGVVGAGVTLLLVLLLGTALRRLRKPAP